MEQADEEEGEELQKAGRDWSDAGGRPPGSKSQAVSPPAPSAAELRVAELERLLGRKQLEVDFLKRAFEQVRGAVSNRTNDGGKESIVASRSRSLSLFAAATPEQADLLLRARLQELAVVHHRLCGYRMLTALLRREGQLVNHQRVRA
jgi:hypothetical protein